MHMYKHKYVYIYIYMIIHACIFKHVQQAVQTATEIHILHHFATCCLAQHLEDSTPGEAAQGGVAG